MKYNLYIAFALLFNVVYSASTVAEIGPENNEDFVEENQRANIELGSILSLSGGSGTLSNAFGGDGLIKGWAKINEDGSIYDCYRCTPRLTVRNDAGTYAVDFPDLSSDIRSRPKSVSLESHDRFIPRSADEAVGFTSISASEYTPSRVWIYTLDRYGNYDDRSFTVIVY